MLQSSHPPTPRAEKPWQNAEEGMSMMDLQSEEEAPRLELDSYVQMLVFQKLKLVSSTFLLWYTTQGVHRAGRLLGS